MKLFIDSSALAKRYVREPGSDQIAVRCGEASEISLSVVCSVEIISALNRLRREGKLAPRLYKQLKQEFGCDISEARIIPLDDQVIRLAKHCLEKSPLRTLDAIHVASAIVAKSDLFLSSDQQQVRAAMLAGLKTELID